MSNGERSGKSWRVILVSSAKKQLQRIPVKDRERIANAMDTLEENPWSGDIDKLGGDEISWRRRIGNYRILFDIFSAEKIIYVNEIKRRTSSTY